MDIDTDGLLPMQLAAFKTAVYSSSNCSARVTSDDERLTSMGEGGCGENCNSYHTDIALFGRSHCSVTTVRKGFL